MKICSKCKQEKPATLEYFSRKASSKDGLRTYCKLCGNAYTQQWKEENPNHQKEYAEANKEKLAAKKKIYRQKNKELISIYQKRWIANNPGYHRKWDDKNRDKRRKAVNSYHTRRRANDVGFRISSNISRSIRYSLSNTATGKNGKRWESLVGYSRTELKAHIERQFINGMAWDNWGAWHIDHIIPINSFSISSADDEEFKTCWSLPNLRPIWAEENQSKSDKLIYLL